MAYDAVNIGWPILGLSGLVTGICSGMLGIGGGLVTIPALMFGLPFLGISGIEVPKIAMATSLVMVIPVSVASTQAHASRGTVDWSLWALIAPSIVAGSLLASIFAVGMNVSALTLLYVGFSLFAAWQLFLVPRTEASAKVGESAKPGLFGVMVKCVGGGALSSLLGLGVGFFAVPMLARFIPLPKAIGTASALALPMAFGGSAGYLLAVAPAGCVDCMGYVYPPAVGVLGMTAVLAAPLGARLSSVLPVFLLRRIFAALLVCGALITVQKKLPGLLGEAWAMIHLPTINITIGSTSSAPASAPTWIGRRSPPLSVMLVSRFGPRVAFIRLITGWPRPRSAMPFDARAVLPPSPILIITASMPRPDSKKSRVATRRSPPITPGAKTRRTTETPPLPAAAVPNTAGRGPSGQPDILKTLFGN